MRQFVLPDDWDRGPRCTVVGGRARYVARVLRLSPGDEFPAIDASGGRWLCRVERASAEALELSLRPPPEGPDTAILPDIRAGKRADPERAGGQERAPAPGRPSFTLVQGIPRGAKMDLIVRQATEAGVARIIPLRSLRSRDSESEGGSARGSRWERIVREALQQSGSEVPTRVEESARIEELPGLLGGGGKPSRVSILLHELPLEPASLHEYLSGAPEEVVLCVGPEGGFAAEEVQRLLGLGFSPYTFPGAVLRAETAAIYAIAAVQTILAERESWILPLARIG